jgi:hypothetical protein
MALADAFLDVFCTTLIATAAESRALAYTILSELYDPGKQAAFERQPYIRKGQRRTLSICAAADQTIAGGWRMSV